MAAISPSLRDRITAAALTVLVHALVIVLLVVELKSGGGPRSRVVRDAAPGEQTWTAVRFVTEPKQAAPQASPVVPVTEPQPEPAEETSKTGSVSEPVADGESASADALSATDAASFEAAVLPPRDAAASFDAGASGTEAPEDDLGVRYLAAVRAAILEQWNAMGGGVIPAGCELVIDQADGGQAIRAWVRQCGDLPLSARIRLETAAMQVQPLPYEGFESVFQDRLKLAF